MNKRGQVTMFIIIAIVIVAIAVVAYFVYPKITSSATSSTPTGFIQNCLEDEIAEQVETISLNGGKLEPEFYADYFGEKIEYLCYTSENYALCTMQVPFVRNHVEEEIKNAISEKADECFESLTKGYEKSGYEVGFEKNDFEVNIIPESVFTSFDYSLTLTKDSTNKYENFNVILDNNLYELISISESMLNWEAEVGDVDTAVYMDFYSGVKIEKKKKTDGTKIYILTDKSSENKFRFASRSLVWPSGI